MTIKNGGFITIGKLLLILVLSTIGWLSYNVIPIFYSYLELDNQLTSISEVGDELTDGEIRQRISKQLKILQIPAVIDDVYIDRYRDSVSISLVYSEDLYFSAFGREVKLWQFDFEISTE
jgi:hypothetical protein